MGRLFVFRLPSISRSTYPISTGRSGSLAMLSSRKASRTIDSLFLFSCFLFQPSYANYNLSQNQSLVDGQTLVSPGEEFMLGFFSPPNSQRRFVGIWYHKISVQTVVWVANRERPIEDSSGIIKIGMDGNLKVLEGNGRSVWSSNVSAKISTAELTDSGNLELKDGSSGKVIWQSFEEPTDSFLPGMKIGLNRMTEKSWYLTSWKSPENPSTGVYSLRLDTEGILQQTLQGILLEGSNRRWRTGPWDGSSFVDVSTVESTNNPRVYIFNNRTNGDLYLTYPAYSSVPGYYLIDSFGSWRYRYWSEEKNSWISSWEQPVDQCEIYGHCGANANCDLKNSPMCSCLRGFEPKYPQDWALGDWSEGCVRRIPLECEKKKKSSSETSAKRDGLLRLTVTKIPDHPAWSPTADSTNCEAKCRTNCSCIAFVNTSGTGCMLWDGELMDLRQYSKGGLDFYIRLDSSEFAETRERRKILLIVLVTTGLAIVMASCGCFLWMRKEKRRESKIREKGEEQFLFNLDTSTTGSPNIFDGNTNGKCERLPLLDIHIVATATNNFSTSNKLGEGGFGPVYMGMLPNGNEIAVKRLSKSSGQGLEEFKNEVILISKLQHRNLVRLLGCCINSEEKLLVYEYMPNRSLDAFLFDQTKGRLLDWRTRFNIVEGIARGLLYLHRDSRLKIIHRDLKPSNILLDNMMNPKISDFGMAKIFGGNQTQANTNRVVGTYGYMSPEYAMKGIFSEKSDVFSFGIIILEIVTGKRNKGFYHHQYSLNLLGYAWTLWNENNWMELVDPLLSNSFQKEEVLKCIHVALLCVQDDVTNRPTMPSVVSMLGSEAIILTTPKQPAYFTDGCPVETNLQMDDHESFSINYLTLSMVDER